MAQLKSTNVAGNLSVLGNTLASKFIKHGGTSDDLLLADGSTTSLATIMGNINAAITLKGTLGSGGTITTLGTPSASVLGYGYKVITAGTYDSKTAKIGDMFVCYKTASNSYEWMHIPSGDDIEDTRNTAGATNSSSKLFLIGATTQGDNPQTYSNQNIFIDTSGNLVVNNGKFSGTATNADTATSATSATNAGHATTAGGIAGIQKAFAAASSPFTPAKLTTEIGTNGFNIKRGSWDYAANGVIEKNTSNATQGCPFGTIDLAGVSIAQWYSSANNFTQLFITASTSSGESNVITGEMLYYINNGSDYSPTWYRVLTNNNYNQYTYSKSSINTYLSEKVAKGGDTMTGDLLVKKANAAVKTMIADGSNSVGIYSSTNRGLYDFTSGHWLIYKKADDNTVRVPQPLYVDGSLTLTKNADIAPGSYSSPALTIGSYSGEHIEFDTNEIVAKSNDSTPSILYLGESGGGVNINNCSLSVGTLATAAQGFRVTQSDGDNGYGISLYGTATPQTYGIYFAHTKTFGSYGSVTGDWATYFGMNNDNSRGWIFRTEGGCSASISGGGNLFLKGTVTIGTKAVLQYDATNECLNFVFN